MLKQSLCVSSGRSDARTSTPISCYDIRAMGVDELIVEVANGRRLAATGDGNIVREHIARAPFSRACRTAIQWGGHGYSVVGEPHPSKPNEKIEDQTYLTSLEFHTAKRVLQGQWKSGTTPSVYESDCQTAAAAAHIVRAGRTQDGDRAATQTRQTSALFSPNLNIQTGHCVLVVYDAHKRVIVSGYNIAEATAPTTVYRKWLKPPKVLPLR